MRGIRQFEKDVNEAYSKTMLMPSKGCFNTQGRGCAIGAANVLHRVSDKYPDDFVMEHYGLSDVCTTGILHGFDDFNAKDWFYRSGTLKLKEYQKGVRCGQRLRNKWLPKEKVAKP